MPDNSGQSGINSRYASLVQLVERRSPKPDVEGSSPSGRELYKREGDNISAMTQSTR